MTWAINYYRDKTTEKLSLANTAMKDMQKRQRDAVALDTKYTKELADAKAENYILQRKLDYGSRVLVKGRCPVPATTDTPGSPAWAMMKPSNSLMLLDETFSVPEMELLVTKQH